MSDEETQEISQAKTTKGESGDQYCVGAGRGMCSDIGCDAIDSAWIYKRGNDSCTWESSLYKYGCDCFLLGRQEGGHDSGNDIIDGFASGPVERIRFSAVQRKSAANWKCNFVFNCWSIHHGNDAVYYPHEDSEEANTKIESNDFPHSNSNWLHLKREVLVQNGNESLAKYTKTHIGK